MKKKYIFIKTNSQIQRVNLADIRYIEGMKEYLGVVLEDARMLTLQSFSDMMKLLPESEFVRVHKSYIAPCQRTG